MTHTFRALSQQRSLVTLMPPCWRANVERRHGSGEGCPRSPSVPAPSCTRVSSQPQTREQTSLWRDLNHSHPLMVTSPGAPGPNHTAERHPNAWPTETTKYRSLVVWSHYISMQHSDWNPGSWSPMTAIYQLCGRFRTSYQHAVSQLNFW